jgi:hypothetical protein
MKLKLNLLVSVLVLYLLLGGYLIYSYFDFRQYLADFELIDLTPLAQIMLAFSISLFALALFSIFRIPFFHYLFKMLNLWIVIITGAIVGLFFRYSSELWDTFSAGTQQSLATAFPVSNAAIFKPLMVFAQTTLNAFKEKYLYVLLGVVIAVSLVQLVLYLPSSLRYVYHTHISPFKYIIKHIFVSVVVLTAVLFAANLYVKLDSGINPQLESLLAAEPEPVNESENAFYPMLTIWAPNVDDRNAAGRQWVSEYQAMLAYFRKQNRPVKPAEYPHFRKINLPGINPDDQAAINQIYIKRLTGSGSKFESEIKKYAERYKKPLAVVRSMEKYKKYQNPIKNTDVSYTEYFEQHNVSLLSLHRLNLLVSLIEHNSENRALTRNIFADYFFNLLVIKNSSDPVTKMFYLEKQSIIVEFLYTVLLDPAYQNSDFYKLIEYIPILDEESLDFRKVARDKILFFKKQLDSRQAYAGKGSSAAKYILEYTFKYNKTLNCIYDSVNKELNLDNKDPVAHIKVQKVKIPKARIDNVLGDIICNVSIPEYYSEYYSKAIEVNGKILMIKALAESTEKGIRDINMHVFLNNSRDKYYNPFNAQALGWDRDARRIYFEYNNGIENIRVQY